MLNDGPLFFIYEPENYEMYDTSKPYLQNVAKAHGGFNSSNIDIYGHFPLLKNMIMYAMLLESGYKL